MDAQQEWQARRGTWNREPK